MAYSEVRNVIPWQSIPSEVLEDLGTVGNPKHSPIEFFSQSFPNDVEMTKAIQLYFDQDFGKALETIDESNLIAQNDAEAFAWRSFISYRLQEFPQALYAAQQSVAKDPTLGLAHQALAMVYNEQTHSASWTNEDSTRVHIIRTTELAPILSSPWMIRWAEMIKMDDKNGETLALQGMIDNHVFTPGMLEYSRWVLQSIPKNALFLVNGDMDTYPMLYLMQAEDLRPDVDIVNISMLDHESYSKVLTQRAGLDWPLTDQDFRDVLHIRLTDGTIEYTSKRIIKGWSQRAKADELGRPLAWALSVPFSNLDPTLTDNGQLIGGCFSFMPGAGKALCHPQLVAKSFDGIDQKTLMSNYSYPAETSPIIGMAANALAGNPISVLFRYIYVQLNKGNLAEASWGLDLVLEMIALGDLQQEYGERAASYGALLHDLE